MARPTPRRPRHAYPIGRAERVRRQNFIAVGIAVCVLALLGTGGWLFYQARASVVAVDAHTLCPVSGPPTAVTAVLIDASDPISPVQTEAIRREVDALRDTLPRHGAFEIYLVGETIEATRQPLFKACNPGNPDDVDELTGSRKLVAQKWSTGFAEPMAAAFAKAVPHGTEKTSPIMESIQSVAVTAFGGPKLNEVPKRFVIVSDMMQNTPAFSHYRSTDYDRFRSSGAATAMLADLRGVDVQILYVRRQAAQRWQGAKHALFWQAYLSAQGATVSRILSVTG